MAVDLGGRTLGGTTVQALAERVAAAAPALRAIPDGELLAAWNDTLAAFLDRGSPERRALEPGLLDSTGLSPEGLHRSLQAIGAGLQGDPAAAVVRLAPKQRGRGFSLVILPATPPGLILQSLLPALAARAPVLFKPSRAEPHFGPAFLAALGQRLPAVGAAFAAANWAGGDRSVEQDLYGRARVVVAYGNDSTIASIESVLAAARDRHLPDSDPRGVWNRSVLRPKAATRFVAFGPKLSLGWVGADADLERAALGMALDVALFDQRGCLSVEAVLVETNVGETAPAAQLPSAAVPHEARETPACRSREFARLLDAALGRLAAELPPGRSSPAELAGVRLAREDADLRGLTRYGGRLDASTVIVEAVEAPVAPSPGLRTVRVHTVRDRLGHDEWPLGEWTSRLQGVAVAGSLPEPVRRALEDAGVSRFAASGDLQATDASWKNGGVDLAAKLARPVANRKRRKDSRERG